MSDWRDGYREGSFRDVPFKTESHTLRGGRRKQDREFAKRDIGNSEDLGRSTNGFTLEIFVLGDDYFDQRDALIKALEAEGPGRLVHPYLGTKSVQAGKYNLVETVGEGRLARFTVEFSESGQEAFPEEIVSNIEAVISNVDAESQSFFEQVFDVANQAAQVVQAGADGIDTVVDFMEDAVKKVTGPIANLTFAIRNIKASVNDLITTPGILAARISEMFGILLDELSGDPDSASRILGQFLSIDDEFTPVLGDTPSNEKQRGNQTATINLAKEISLAGNAQAAIDIDFLSTNAALEKQREIVEGLDIQLNQTTDDQLFQAIKDLQTELTRAIPQTGITELIEITPIKTIPALVIAYAEFQDLDKENEIVEHPGFVPGGQLIKVSAG